MLPLQVVQLGTYNEAGQGQELWWNYYDTYSLLSTSLTNRFFSKGLSQGRTLADTNLVSPAEIPKQRPWVGAYRLVVAAPIIAFDIYWRGDEPLRIMTFSRGDWEDELLALAR